MILIFLAPRVAGDDRNFTGRFQAATQNATSISEPRVTSDARFLVFTTASDILGIGTPVGVRQVYRFDRTTGTILLLSRDDIINQRDPSPSNCFRPAVSDDGNLVVFDTAAALVAGDTNGVFDVYIRHVDSFFTERLSEGPGGTSDGLSFAAAISRSTDQNGDHFVAFTSLATNLGGAGVDLNGILDVYRVRVPPVQDPPGTPELVTLDNSAPPVQSFYPGTNWLIGGPRAISDGGCRVLFIGAPCDWGAASCGTSNCLCPQPDDDCAACESGEHEEIDQVYMRDLCADPPRTFRVSRVATASFTAGNNVAFSASIAESTSGEGGPGAVAFSTRASNLPGDSDGGDDVFYFDFTTPSQIDSIEDNPVLVSRAVGGGSGGGQSVAPVVLAINRTVPGFHVVAFHSTGSDLVSGDTNNVADVFVAQMSTNGTAVDSLQRYSVTMTSGDEEVGEADDLSGSPDVAEFPVSLTAGAVSRIGVAYESVATDLVAGDTNNVRDVFITRQRAFERGDADGNGTVVPSVDGQFICNFLFLSGTPPGCMDTADTNDSGTLDVSDCSFSIPPAPGPGCTQSDPSEDDLSCVVYAPCAPN